MSKNDQNKPMIHLIIPQFIWEMGEVLTLGSRKYGVNNWRNLDPNRILSALYRHLLKYHSGSKRDEESGKNHMIHIGCNAMFLYYFDEIKEGEK